MILDYLKKQSQTLIEAQQTKNKLHPILTLIIFFVLFITGYVIIFIPMEGINIVLNFYGKPQLLEPGLSELGWLENLFLIFVILVFIAYCKWIEKRSLRSMGFTKQGIISKYLKGALVGLGMLSLSLALCVLAGAMEYQGMVMGVSGGIIVLWLFGFMVQGMEEEVLLRGYMMVSLSNRMPIVWAIAISSLVFAVMHAANDSFGWLPMINLTLYGIFISLYFLYSDNLWTVAAQHSVWNWAQGNLYGIEVSGSQIDATVFRFTSTEGKELISGGDFGLEGGLAVTLVLTLGIVYCAIKLKQQRNEKK